MLTFFCFAAAERSGPNFFPIADLTADPFGLALVTSAVRILLSPDGMGVYFLVNDLRVLARRAR